MNSDIIEFHITEHCNLNCKSCMHFSPLAQKEYAQTKILFRDMKTIANLKKDVKEIHILGGEPLLHPKLLKILKNTRKIFPTTDILLISNGILLLKQKEVFWKTLKNEKIHLSVTSYPLNLDYAEISHMTKKYSIKYDFYASDKSNSQWYFPLDLSKSGDIIYNFQNCSKNNNCTNINIQNGKLYLCPVVAYIRHFNKFFNKEVKVCDEDFLTLKNIKNFKEIEEFINKPTPFCAYCNVPKRTYNNKWEISKKKIEEWV